MSKKKISMGVSIGLWALSHGNTIAIEADDWRKKEWQGRGKKRKPRIK